MPIYSRVNLDGIIQTVLSVVNKLNIGDYLKQGRLSVSYDVHGGQKRRKTDVGLVSKIDILEYVLVLISCQSSCSP